MDCKKNNWDFIVVGDKKTPKNFKLPNAKYINYKKKLKIFHFQINAR